MDEGPPISYLLLASATPVYGSDGDAAGKVKKVLCEEQIVQTRDRISGFASLEDLGMVLDLPGDEVERLRGHVVFLPDYGT